MPVVGLLKELLREPNHHQRKSNQKEEGARACVVVFRSHVAKGQISGSARRYIRLSAGIRVNVGPSREDFAIVHWRTRVVPLRTVNEGLNLAANLSQSQLNMVHALVPKSNARSATPKKPTTRRSRWRGL